LLDKKFSYSLFSKELWTTAAAGRGSSKRFGRANIVLNVIDSRQEYPQAMVKQALEVLGFHEQANRLQHVSYGVVSLSPATAEELGIDTSAGKASYAMSGRQGIGIKVADMVLLMERVIEEKRSRRTGLSSKAIAAAAIRYYLLRYNLQTEVVFDLHKATEISGNTGVYLLYAYARAASIIAKAGKELVPLSEPQFDSAQQLEPAESALLRKIAGWPDVLIAAAEERAPNLLANYAYELATTFNTFYAACPILKADEERRGFRIGLTLKYQETLGESLQLLGLPTPSRM
ncbi:MAG: argS, partial [Paenibacillus sp.]|nr:argS [Paenibacillus sp.]